MRDFLKRMVKAKSKHAGGFLSDRKGREANEMGIAEDWANSYYGVETNPFIRIVSRVLEGRRDPPDCEAEYIEGGLLGIELSELVNQKVRAETEALKNRMTNEEKQGPLGFFKPYRYVEYTKEDLVLQINATISKKETKEFLGGPYKCKLLLIYSDEPDLKRKKVAELLKDVKFKCGYFDKVHLMLFPEPDASDSAAVTQEQLDSGAVPYHAYNVYELRLRKG